VVAYDHELSISTLTIRFDTAVLGLGAMGSAAAAALAKRGARVIAFDRHAPPHTIGSSHGRSRVIREAYYEHPLYVPLVRRAYDLWEELERETGLDLLRTTGGLMVGPEQGTLFGGALASARTHDIAHEVLDANAISQRFPAYQAAPTDVGLLEHRAGMLFPERCIQAHLQRAGTCQATLHINEEVRDWAVSATGVTVRTNTGTYLADRLVVAAGPWLPALEESLGRHLPLEIERQLSHWFRPSATDAAKYDATHAPIALWELAHGELFATLPNLGDGVKCGAHHGGPPTTPHAVDRTVSDRETQIARTALETVMPGAGGALLESRVCLYTNTPDAHFIIDWVQKGRVLLLSPCSGHGFKFASAIGEIAAQLVLDDRAWIDLEPFALKRFDA